MRVDVDRPNLCVRHREHSNLRHLFQRRATRAGLYATATGPSSGAIGSP